MCTTHLSTLLAPYSALQFLYFFLALASIQGLGFGLSQAFPILGKKLLFAKGILCVGLLRFIDNLWLGNSLSWLWAGAGTLLFFCYLFTNRHHFHQFSVRSILPDRGSPWIWSIILVAFALLLSRLLFIDSQTDKLYYFPLQNDAVAIWFYKAKVLSCESLFHSALLNEKVWTFAHPEYPVLFSLITSFFFQISHSFHDFWPRFWMALLSFTVLMHCLRSMHSSKATTNITLLLLTPLLLREEALLTPELLLAVFFTLGLWSLCRKELLGIKEGRQIDPLSLSIALVFLCHLKTEGLVLSGLLLVLTPFYEYVFHQTKMPKKFWLLYLIPLTSFIFLKTLPSHHEQYGQQVLSLDVWRNGIHRIPYLVSSIMEYLSRAPWVFVTTAFLWTVLISQKLWTRTSFLLLGIFTCFLAFVMLVYTVTPWAANLHQETFTRLFLPVSFALLSIAPTLIAKSNTIRWKRWVPPLFLGFLILFNIELIVRIHQTPAEVIKDNLEAHEAFRLGKQLTHGIPLGSKVAIIGEYEANKDFWTNSYYWANYVAYPNLLYPAPKDSIVFTAKPTKLWNDFPRQKPSLEGMDYTYDLQLNELAPLNESP